MGNYKSPTECGSGGKRGHSNMGHWIKTEEIKDSTRVRRQEDRRSSREGINDMLENVVNEKTIILYRPTGSEELKLVRESGFTKWPPRLPEQPIFYPVTNQEYAEQIAKEWNVKDSGVGYVTKFHVKTSFMQRYEIQKVGGRIHTEWWVPAEELQELNKNIVGKIEVIAEFKT